MTDKGRGFRVFSWRNDGAKDADQRSESAFFLAAPGDSEHREEIAMSTSSPAGADEADNARGSDSSDAGADTSDPGKSGPASGLAGVNPRDKRRPSSVVESQPALIDEAGCPSCKTVLPAAARFCVSCGDAQAGYNYAPAAHVFTSGVLFEPVRIQAWWDHSGQPGLWAPYGRQIFVSAGGSAGAEEVVSILPESGHRDDGARRPVVTQALFSATRRDRLIAPPMVSRLGVYGVRRGSISMRMPKRGGFSRELQWHAPRGVTLHAATVDAEGWLYFVATETSGYGIFRMNPARPVPEPLGRSFGEDWSTLKGGALLSGEGRIDFAAGRRVVGLDLASQRLDVVEDQAATDFPLHVGDRQRARLFEPLALGSGRHLTPLTNSEGKPAGWRLVAQEHGLIGLASGEDQVLATWADGTGGFCLRTPDKLKVIDRGGALVAHLTAPDATDYGATLGASRGHIVEVRGGEKGPIVEAYELDRGRGVIKPAWRSKVLLEGEGACHAVHGLPPIAAGGRLYWSVTTETGVWIGEAMPDPRSGSS